MEYVPGKEGYPPSRVNFRAMFIERLYEKRQTLCLSQELTTALAHTLIVWP